MVHNPVPKTLGPQTALLFTQLYEQSKTKFTLADVKAITGLRGTQGGVGLRQLNSGWCQYPLPSLL